MEKTSPKSRAHEGTPARPPRADTPVRSDVPVSTGGIVAGKYRIDAVNGFGGMGIVCEAFHLDLQTKVEVQIARREQVNDERTVARILSEVRSAAQLCSQHTRRILDCGRLDVGAPYMVVEHIDGADLRRIRATHGRLPVEEALSFVLQACESLGEAHNRGIVHGDLAPENLYLTHGPDGGALIKVHGLGVSKHSGRQRGSGAPNESAGNNRFSHYMSPEQMVDPTAVDGRSDVWTLGVLLHELLAGELPFGGKSGSQVSGNALTAQPRSLSEVDTAIPESLAAIVLRCMDRKPDARFPDATALGSALKAFGGLTASVNAERVEEILRRSRLPLPESEASQFADAPASVVDMPASVVDVPASVVEQRDSVVDMPASVVDVPDSVAPPPARSVPAMPVLPPPPKRPSQATKPPPLPPSHSPPPPALKRLLGKHGARFALAGGLLGLFFGFVATFRSHPAPVPSSVSATPTSAPVIESARRAVEPDRPVVEPDEPVRLPSAAPVASPAPPPRAPATAQEPASQPARAVAPPQKPPPGATSASHAAPKRAWNPFPELKQPVLPPNVR